MSDIDDAFQIWKVTGKGRVSENALINQELPVEHRLQSIEFDLAVTSKAVHEIFTQQSEIMQTQQKYMDYIDHEIAKSDEDAKFKKDLRKKLVTGGIFTTFSVVGTLVFLGLKEWLRT